jgi:hypothetical protein
MLMLARVTFPTEEGNRALRDGTMHALIEETVNRWKPEATYFTSFEGKRQALIFFNAERTHDLSEFMTPFFMKVNAEVLVVPAVNMADFRTGMADLHPTS